MAPARIIDVDAREEGEPDESEGSDLEDDLDELVAGGLVIHVVGAGRGRVDVVAYDAGTLVHDKTVRARDVVPEVWAVLESHLLRGVSLRGADLLRDLADRLEGKR